MQTPQIKSNSSLSLVNHFSKEINITLFMESRDSAVGIMNGCWLDNRGVGVRVPVGQRIFISLYRLHLLWGPRNLSSIEFQGISLRKQSGKIFIIIIIIHI
jgi:hypothetical protein